MKKFLSLVLALVMTMSLVTISAGAKTFEDDAAIDYTEAVEVMKGVGVIDGYADGSFNPNATLTRGAAAKIICNMILGPTNAGALTVTAAPFKDVPADNVFAGYISYCVSEGIVSGYADGTFRPAGTLTGYAFMKMLLGALGYDAAVEGYSGIPSWSVNVAKRALNIGLDDGLVNDFNGTKAVTRQEACLYAFNTMKTPMVKYPNSSTVTIGDIQISTSADAEEVTTKEDTATITGTKGGDGKVEFAEKFFPKLKLTASSDAYGRPANKWEYGKDTIGTYVKTAAMVYTDAVKGTVMADEIDDADLDVAKHVYLTVNSYALEDDVEKAFSKALESKADMPYTGKGVQFELYANTDDEIYQIVVIYSVLGKVTSIVDDKASTKSVNEANITVETSKFGDVRASAEKLGNDKCKAIGFKDVYGNVKVDDYVIVVPKANKYSSASFTWGEGNFFNATSAISIAVPETVKGVMTYKNTASKAVTIDGTSYSMAYTFGDDTACAVSDKGVVAYVDAYGYLMMVDGVSATADKSVAVLDVYNALNKNGKIVPMIKGVTSNGEIVNWEINDEDAGYTAGTVYTYTEDSSVYTLYDLKTTFDAYKDNDDVHLTSAQAGMTYAVELDAQDAPITTSTKKICTYYQDDDASAKTYTYFADTVKFIFVSNNSGKWTATVKEGAQKVDANAKLAITIDDDGNIATVYVLAAPKNSIDTSDALILIAKKTGDVSVYDKGQEKYVPKTAYDAYVNGVKVDNFYADYDSVAPGTFYKNEVDTDTGEYVLTGNEFTGDETYSVVKGTLAYHVDADTWYKSSKLIVVGNEDLGISGKTVFADNTDHEVESLSALKNLVVTEQFTSDVAALYDTKTGEALFVYVTDATYLKQVL